MSPTPTFTCCHCNRQHPLADLRRFNEMDFCPDCLDEATVVCDDCGSRVDNERNYGNEGHPLCERCYDRNYVTCDRCGTVIHRDDVHYAHDDDDEEWPLCWGCYHKLNRDIHDYSYKPELIFYGGGPRYFGVELEINECSAPRHHSHKYSDCK